MEEFWNWYVQYWADMQPFLRDILLIVIGAVLAWQLSERSKKSDK